LKVGSNNRATQANKRLAGSLSLGVGGLLLGLISMGKQRKNGREQPARRKNIPCGSVDHVPCCDQIKTMHRPFLRDPTVDVALTLCSATG